MDLLGCTTFAIPFIGELVDLLWAPLSALIYWRTFGFSKGLIGGGLHFLEEILPGTDIIPMFTITWLIQCSKRKKGNYSIQPL